MTMFPLKQETYLLKIMKQQDGKNNEDLKEYMEGMKRRADQGPGDTLLYKQEGSR